MSFVCKVPRSISTTVTSPLVDELIKRARRRNLFLQAPKAGGIGPLLVTEDDDPEVLKVFENRYGGIIHVNDRSHSSRGTYQYKLSGPHLLELAKELEPRLWGWRLEVVKGWLADAPA